MKSYDFTNFETKFFPEWLQQFKIGPNIWEYSYIPNGDPSIYGTTDMLISKYILNDLDLSDQEKDGWADYINTFQDPKTGYYHKRYTLHFKEHTVAYAVAALKLIDRQPKYPMAWKTTIIGSQTHTEQWLSNTPNWSLIWSGSHVVSGVPAALVLTNEGTADFFKWYFEWLDHTADASSGFWRRGLLHKISGKNKIAGLHDMAGAFHMYYIYEFFKRKWLYPEKIVDHTLRLQHSNGLWDKDVTYCVDLDGIYCLTRSSRNADGYRVNEIKAAIEAYLKTAEQIFNDRERFFRSYRNSHRLTGALAAIAECQLFCPEMVRTVKPWHQSLDKACYI